MAARLVRSGALAHAGGVDVVALLQRGESADEVVHLGGIDELDVLELDGDVLRVGSMVTHHRMETDELLRSVRPDLAAAWATVGNVRIRRTGTVGGNVLARDSSYDAAPLLCAAGGSMLWADGTRTAIDSPEQWPRELLLGFEVPASGTVAFDRSLKPVVSVAVGEAAVAIGCAYDSVVSIEADALDELPAPRDDAFASSSYRARMIRVLTERLMEARP